VRTRIGCAMQCAYCLTANLNRRHANADVEVVLEEIALTVCEARRRGIGTVPLMFADDEFNLPDEQHARAVLEGILERGLASSLSWRGYFNPTPFSDELAELIKKTNGHVSVTVDTAAEAVMARINKPFRRRHLDRLLETISRYELSADMGFIFGLPGESEQTVRETGTFIRLLPKSIDVVYSAGARVYPHTPLAAIARQEPRHVYGGTEDFFAPAVYCSPLAPRQLARLLKSAFADLDNVEPVGVGFGRGRRTAAHAYRVALGQRPRDDWAAVLDDAAMSGDARRSRTEALAGVMQIAVWHDRFDLAGAACSRLLRERVPPSVRAGLHLTRLGYAALRMGNWARRTRPRARANTAAPAR
jgi:hypothetical protein